MFFPERRFGKKPWKELYFSKICRLKTHGGAKIRQEKQDNALLSSSEYNQINFNFVNFKNSCTLPKICAKYDFLHSGQNFWCGYMGSEHPARFASQKCIFFFIIHYSASTMFNPCGNICKFPQLHVGT